MRETNVPDSEAISASMMLLRRLAEAMSPEPMEIAANILAQPAVQLGMACPECGHAVMFCHIWHGPIRDGWVRTCACHLCHKCGLVDFHSAEQVPHSGEEARIFRCAVCDHSVELKPKPKPKAEAELRAA